MDVSQPRVCVIGAGLSGLVSVKCMLDAGFNVTCFEKEDRVAGRWNPGCEHPIPRSTVTNLPHFYSGYSDFPLPDDFPLYLPAELFCRYFELYVEEFNLAPYIKLGHKVVNTVPLTSSNGQQSWRVSSESKDGSTIEMEFDYLVVSSGFYQLPFIPESISKSISGFKGTVIHSINYTSWKDFEDKTVVVCGLGNSGGDIVCELSHHSHKAYISTSRGSYVYGRFFNNGNIPIEATSNRIGQYIPQFMKGYLTKMMISKMANFVYNLDGLRLTPKSVTSGIVNDEICLRIAAGKVVVKPNIERVEGHTVHFSNGTAVDNVDAIIMCTGYKRKYEFFDENIFQFESRGKYVPLYKGIFSPQLHDNVAFIGMFSVFGSVALTSEMQARYAAEVFRKKVKLPNKEKMELDIKAYESFLKRNYGDDLKEFNLIHNAWDYFNGLAEEIGCRPSLLYLWFTDPVLAWTLLKSYSPHEYRLIGPNRWSGARQAILNRGKRMYAFMDGSRKIS